MAVKCPITWNSMRVYAVTIFFGENFQKKKISLICPIWRKLFTEEEEEIVRWGILQWCAGHLSFDLKKGHVSKFNFIFHPWICTTLLWSKGPSYIFDASFFRMPLPPRKYIYENYFARGLTHQFSIDHHTLIHTQYTLKSPKKCTHFFPFVGCT